MGRRPFPGLPAYPNPFTFTINDKQMFDDTKRHYHFLRFVPV
jgi:hypothetical protein